MTILFYEYSRYSGDALYEQFADEILESIMELPDDLSLDLSDGLCGIGWGITYLLRERFITGEIKDVLSDIDIKIQETEILNDDTLKDYRKRLLNYILCIRFFSGMHSIVSASQFPYTNLSQGCH